MDTYCGAWLSRGTRVSGKAHRALRREKQTISSLTHPAWPYRKPGHRTRDSVNTSSTFDQEAPILKCPQKSKPAHEAGMGQQPSARLRLTEGRCPAHTPTLLAPSTADAKLGPSGKSSSLRPKTFSQEPPTDCCFHPMPPAPLAALSIAAVETSRVDKITLKTHSICTAVPRSGSTRYRHSRTQNGPCPDPTALLTGLPLGPSSPGGPLGPGGPAAPEGPASPFSPLSPLGPWRGR